MLRMRQRQHHEQDDENRQKRIRQTVGKKPHIKPQQWLNLFKNNNSNKLKKHILRFFLIEGHYDIAKQFAQQANIDPKQISQINEQAIYKRYQIVNLIKLGQIDEALQKIKLIDNCKMFDQGMGSEDNQIQSSQSQIIFCLKGLKVINLIKEKKLQKAVILARTQLLPFVKINANYMNKIQQIMSLLVFPKVQECSNYYLTTVQYRNKISKQINTLLLQSQNKSKQMVESIQKQQNYDNISQMLKLTKWLQKRLQNYLQFPKIKLQSFQNQKIFQISPKNH